MGLAGWWCLSTALMPVLKGLLNPSAWKWSSNFFAWLSALDWQDSVTSTSTHAEPFHSSTNLVLSAVGGPLYPAIAKAAVDDWSVPARAALGVFKSPTSVQLEPFHCSVFAEFAVPGLSPAKTKLLVLDSAKSKKKLLWKSRYSIKKSLTVTSEWYKSYLNNFNLEKISFKQFKAFFKNDWRY